MSVVKYSAWLYQYFCTLLLQQQRRELMPQDLDKIRQIKEAAEADLLKRPGVTGVDVGYKYVGGKKTEEIVIRVHVAEKKDVPPDQKIPETINGVKTDVHQNRFVPAGDFTRYDPLLGGASIGPCRLVGQLYYGYDTGPNVWPYGTLGAIVIDNTSGARMMLGNFHVMCVDTAWKVGDAIGQPSDSSGPDCSSAIVGTIQQAFLGGEVDCAVASITARDHINAIMDIGPVTGIADPVLGTAVRKRGATTGLTFGTIDSLYLTIQTDYGENLGSVQLTNQISIAADPTHNTQFADFGDSGSVVVNSANQVIGLLFGVDAAAGTVGATNPIKSVLDKLNVSMAIEGIGGYDLRVAADRAFAFDYDGTGKLDHLVLYRPNYGTIWILTNSAGQFSAVYAATQ
jgi:hypothetical protein